ncbi:MAG: adenylate kinase [Erysipelotrichaceae bacterium]|jgi:adenylate kinase|nr:adenylate kinase [Erysipelotrichaceae bacterium]
MNVLIMGAAGSGKGTLSKKIAEKYKIAHISSGDMFRAAIQSGSELGLTAKQYIDQGRLVPDELTVALIRERITEPDCEKGFLLDGYPRTLPQAKDLLALCEELDKPLAVVLHLEIETAELVSRITGRRICANCGAIYNITHQPSKIEGRCDLCGGTLLQRSDDTEERLLVRMQEYEELTRPVIDWLKERVSVIEIDAGASVGEVWQQVQDVLGGTV